MTLGGFSDMDWNDVSTERLTQAIENGRLTRRQTNKALVSAGLMSIGMVFGPKMAGAAAADHPTVFTWSGYEDDGFMGSYVEAYGEKPNFSFWGDEEEAFAKMRAGFDPDVTAPCSYKINHWNDAGMLAEIDSDRLTNWSEQIPSLTNVPDTIHDGKRLWICEDWGQTSITYRTDLVDIEEESWGLVWDKRYAGRLSMIDSLIDGVMVAAIYIGAKDPYNMTPDEVATTKEALQEQIPLLRFYSNSMTEVEQALASGELVAAASWNNTITTLSKDGLPVAFMFPKEGPMTWTCGIVLMKNRDANMTDRAYDLINAFLSPDTGNYWVMENGMGHANKKTYERISDDDLIMRGLTPGNIEEYIASGIFQATIQNEPELQAMYEEVKAGF
jgi:spermidine/putrescine transport system substrate-binding protein